MPEPFNEIFKAHYAQIKAVALSITRGAGGKLALDGLISAGSVALWQASLIYDPAKGTSLWQSAYLAVRGSMVDELRFLDHLSRDGRKAVQNEVVEKIGHGLLFQCALEAAVNTSSEGDPEKDLFRAERASLSRKAFNCLLGLERRVIHEHIFEDRNLLDIANELGVTESRVCQIKQSAVRTMRRYMGSDNPQTNDESGSRHRGRGVPRMLVFEGREQSISAWAREKGFRIGVIIGRLNNGWTVERALTEPVNAHRKADESGTSIRPPRVPAPSTEVALARIEPPNDDSSPWVENLQARCKRLIEIDQAIVALQGERNALVVELSKDPSHFGRTT